MKRQKYPEQAKTSRIGKSKETEAGQRLARAWGTEEQGMTVQWMEVSFCGDEPVKYLHNDDGGTIL